MKKIAIIGGTGGQGSGLALRWARAGHEIFIGSREKNKACTSADNLKTICIDTACSLLEIEKTDVEAVKEKVPEAKISGFDNLEATKRADIVVISVPYSHLIPTIASIKEGLTEGKIIVSVVVPLSTAVGGKATTIISPWEGSAAEVIQSLVPENVQVISAFQNVSADRLSNLEKDVDCDIIVCGGSKDARKIIMELAKDIPGARAIDGGPLQNARLIEPITALLIGMNIRYKVKEGMGIRFTYLPE
ncbi:MAG: F420-dependent NADP reductase [Candidatus Methanofastidiosum methylothiophilum]|uniref:F420-dependent NADP reductase n=1 Tax=Candidatus Methanofastidiosum methylothiophilum TaxID=1705564 RepID=A0A150IYZ9_9EURY|nr:MAG: F420-dependent NADP reductase [Candidatus Methanofastidiosum methylthiophilus]NMC77121.1 NADPH-dependent F420 reductase [Candidatus Methanofastidiosa archaeon]